MQPTTTLRTGRVARGPGLKVSEKKCSGFRFQCSGVKPLDLKPETRDYVHLFRHKRFCVSCASLRPNRKSVNYFCAFMKDDKNPYPNTARFHQGLQANPSPPTVITLTVIVHRKDAKNAKNSKKISPLRSLRLERAQRVGERKMLYPDNPACPVECLPCKEACSGAFRPAVWARE